MTLLLAPEVTTTEVTDLPATLTVDAWGMASCVDCGAELWAETVWTLDLADQAWDDHLSDPDTPRTCRD